MCLQQCRWLDLTLLFYKDADATLNQLMEGGVGDLNLMFTSENHISGPN